VLEHRAIVEGRQRMREGLMALIDGTEGFPRDRRFRQGKER
jgi:hypothetical protein